MKTLAEINQETREQILKTRVEVESRRDSLGYEDLGTYPVSQLQNAAHFHDLKLEFIDRAQFGADFSLRSQALLKDLGSKEYIETKAPELVKLLQESPFAKNGTFEFILQKGLYVNVKLADSFLLKSLEQVQKLGPRFGMTDAFRGNSAVIEYSSPNVAKHLHAGHIHSTILGHVLSNLYEAAGYTVHRMNYINDWGGFGFLLEGYSRWKNEFSGASSKNELLYQIYLRYRTLEKRVQAETCSPEEGREYEAFTEAARHRFNHLEAGVQGEVDLWQEMIGWSLEEFNEFYSLMGIFFDYTVGESLYASAGNEIVEEALKTGVAELHNNAASVKMGENEEDWFVIRRSDDSSIYATRELAAMKHRLDAFSPAVLAYVVGQEQTSYFTKLFETAKRLGFGAENKTKIEHLSLGMYISAETKKKLSSREGADNVITLLKLAEAHFLGSYHGKAEFTEAEKETNAKLLAIGSIAFNDVKKDRRFPVEFASNPLTIVKEFEEAGGAYVMYTSARARSIVRKAGGAVPNAADLMDAKLEPVEVSLIKKINSFPLSIIKAVETDNPAVVAGAVLDLAREYNSYYEQCAVMVGGEVAHPHRLVITQSVAQVIDNGLRLLHAQGPERI